MQRLKICVTGQVQGVFYRAEAEQVAKRLGIAGFARNEADGSVYIEAEGEPEVLQRFIDWCRRGPSEARVAKVTAEVTPTTGETDFRAIRER